MSDFSYQPQDFSNQQFGQPMYEERKSRGGRSLLFICGGLFAVLLLCCCCCVGAFVVAAREPIASVTFWGTFGATEQWDLSKNFVCEGSQAEQLTDLYASRGVRFTAFNAVDDTIVDGVRADATIEVDGRSASWSATFTTEDAGGILGTCINQINVTQGDIVTGQ